MLKNMIERYREVQARREDGEGGFTLIELLVVVVIIGILVAIAIPLYLNYTQGAKGNSLASDVRNAVVSVAQCTSDNSQNLPASQTFTASGTWTQSACATAGDKVVLSSGTKNLAYTYTAGTAAVVGPPAVAATPAYYTIVASDTTGGGGVTYTYDSRTGQTTKTS